MNTLPDILATTVVGPNDRLVIVLPADTNPERMKYVRQHLDQLDPEFSARVLLVAGVEELAVLRGAA